MKLQLRYIAQCATLRFLERFPDSHSDATGTHFVEPFEDSQPTIPRGVNGHSHAECPLCVFFGLSYVVIRGLLDMRTAEQAKNLLYRGPK